MSEPNEKKKGWWPLAVIGGGCLILIVIAVVVLGILVKKGANWVKDFGENPGKKIAEMVIEKDPNYELISSDDKGGTITFLDKRTGKETTVDWDQFKDGKLVITSGDETTTMNVNEGKATVVGPEGTSSFEAGGGIEKLPKWFDLPAGISKWRSAAHHQRAGGRVAGVISGQSERGLAELTGAFEEKLAAAGFTRKAKTELEGRVILNFERAEEKQSLSIALFSQSGTTGVTISYDQR